MHDKAPITTGQRILGDAYHLLEPAEVERGAAIKGLISRGQLPA